MDWNERNIRSRFMPSGDEEGISSGFEVGAREEFSDSPSIVRTESKDDKRSTIIANSIKPLLRCSRSLGSFEGRVFVEAASVTSWKDY